MKSLLINMLSFDYLEIAEKIQVGEMFGAKTFKMLFDTDVN